MSLKTMISEKMDKMEPQFRRKVMIAGIVVAIFGGGFVWSKISKHEVRKPIDAKSEHKELLPETDLIAKTQISESRKQMDAMTKRMEEQDKTIDELKKLRDGDGKGTASASAQGMSFLPGVPPKSARQTQQPQQQAKLPPMPPLPTYRSEAAASVQSAAPPPPPAPTYRRIGDIAVASYKTVEAKDQTAKDAKDPKELKQDKKKDEQKIILPSGSFMRAQLMNGVYAPIGGGGKSNPVPVLVRIQDSAFLPSSIKLDLKGCFAIADGYGSMSDSRAHMQLRNISCIDRHDRAVIDQPVKGYLVDEDGFAGLRGKIVWKGAEVVARAAFAGFLQGVGQGVRQISTTTSISPLGQTQALSNSAGDIAASGIGQGISTAADELARFYLELVHQQMPTVECPAVKRLTIIIQEKAELVLHEIPGAHRSGVNR